MDEELRRLILRAERYAKTGDQIGLVFARELAKVFRDTERELVRVIQRATAGDVSAQVSAARAIALKAQLRAVLSHSGYDSLAVAATRAASDAMLETALATRTVVQATALQASVGPTLEALREIATMDLFAQGDEVATALWRSLAQWVLTNRPATEIVADLSDALDGHEPFIQTLYDTQVSIFGRQVEATATEELPEDQPYLFVGPVDEKTRPFCLELVGQVLTRAEIAELDNEQLPNSFLTGGGYQCRHSWLAVESAELRAMSGTGERVDGISDDVQRVKERKAEKRRQRAA